MMVMDKSAVGKRLWANRYVLAVLALGLVLMLLPSGPGATDSAGNAGALESTGVSLETEGEKLSSLLAKMQGVGRAEVLLSQSGAVVVCDGADAPSVRLYVTNAVMSYTGLGSDRISVVKMK